MYSLTGGTLYKKHNHVDGITFIYLGNPKKIKKETWSSETGLLGSTKDYYDSFGRAVMVMLMGRRYHEASRIDLMTRMAALRANLNEKQKHKSIEVVAEIVHKKHG